MTAAQAPQRNVGLMAGGAVLLVLALGVGALFAFNLYQYLTVADRWANDPMLSKSARAFGVAIVQAAAAKRMAMFGPVSALFGIGGVTLLVLGLRKK